MFELQKDESNRRCADCNTEYPDWVSMGFMVLLCVQCAHIHKEIIKSPTIPKPKNVSFCVLVRITLFDEYLVVDGDVFQRGIERSYLSLQWARQHGARKSISK